MAGIAGNGNGELSTSSNDIEQRETSSSARTKPERKISITSSSSGTSTTCSSSHSNSTTSSGVSTLNQPDVGAVVARAKKAANSLWIILHAQACRDVRCTQRGCVDSKKLLLHLKTCATNGSDFACPTQYHGCHQARKLLSHYKRCREIRFRQRGQLRRKPFVPQQQQHHVCLICSFVARHAKSALEKDGIKTNSNHTNNKNHTVKSGAYNKIMMSSSPRKPISASSTNNSRAAVGPSPSTLMMPPPPPRKSGASSSLPGVSSINHPHLKNNNTIPSISSAGQEVVSSTTLGSCIDTDSNTRPARKFVCQRPRSESLDERWLPSSSRHDVNYTSNNNNSGNGMMQTTTSSSCASPDPTLELGLRQQHNEQRDLEKEGNLERLSSTETAPSPSSSSLTQEQAGPEGDNDDVGAEHSIPFNDASSTNSTSVKSSLRRRSASCGFLSRGLGSFGCDTIVEESSSAENYEDMFLIEDDVVEQSRNEQW